MSASPLQRCHARLPPRLFALTQNSKCTFVFQLAACTRPVVLSTRGKRIKEATPFAFGDFRSRRCCCSVCGTCLYSQLPLSHTHTSAHGLLPGHSSQSPQTQRRFGIRAAQLAAAGASVSVLFFFLSFFSILLLDFTLSAECKRVAPRAHAHNL